MEIQRVSEIEDLIAQNKLSAAQVFTQMKQLVYRESPCHAACEKTAYEAEIRQLVRLVRESLTLVSDEHKQVWENKTWHLLNVKHPLSENNKESQ